VVRLLLELDLLLDFTLQTGDLARVPAAIEQGLVERLGAPDGRQVAIVVFARGLAREHVVRFGHLREEALELGLERAEVLAEVAIWMKIVHELEVRGLDRALVRTRIDAE
jgi:hypothetical protein